MNYETENLHLTSIMNIILTNHAEERMRYRKMARSDIERTLANPDKSFPGKKADTVKFIRTIDTRRHEVIGKYLADQKAWLILSVWIRGEEDKNWITELFGMVWKVLRWLAKIVIKMVRK